MREVFQAALQLIEGGRRGVLATVTGVSGSAPQKVGAKLLLKPDGSFVGTVGGGTIEAKVLEAARQTLRDGQTRTVRYNLTRDLGMCCGGEMEVFVESIEAQPELYIFGGGHVAKPTAQLAHTVGFRVTVIDGRPEFLNPDRFPGARLLLEEPLDGAKKLKYDPELYILIVNPEHTQDQECLEYCIPQPHKYIGMIGSRRKVAKALMRLRAKGFDQKLLEKVYTPIGIDIGAVTPEEIAVSIVGELIAIRRGHALPNHMNMVPELLNRQEALQAADAGIQPEEPTSP